MKPGKLSNYQLYALFQNKEQNSFIRNTAKTEFTSRIIPETEMQHLLFKYNEFEKPEKQTGLKVQYKLLLIILPLLLIIHIIIAAILLDKGYRKMNLQYRQYITIGFLIWTIVCLLLSKYVLLSNGI
jgi:hypothetical protein